MSLGEGYTLDKSAILHSGCVGGWVGVFVYKENALDTRTKSTVFSKLTIKMKSHRNYGTVGEIYFMDLTNVHAAIKFSYAVMKVAQEMAKNC